MTPTTPYTGTVTLDDNGNRAYLVQQSANGPVSYLLVYDPPGDGAFDWLRVRDAWQYYSTRPGIHTGSPIRFLGFWTYVPGTTTVVVHVVTP